MDKVNRRRRGPPSQGEVCCLMGRQKHEVSTAITAKNRKTAYRRNYTLWRYRWLFTAMFWFASAYLASTTAKSCQTRLPPKNNRHRA